MKSRLYYISPILITYFISLASLKPAYSSTLNPAMKAPTLKLLSDFAKGEPSFIKRNVDGSLTLKFTSTPKLNSKSVRYPLKPKSQIFQNKKHLSADASINISGRVKKDLIVDEDHSVLLKTFTKNGFGKVVLFNLDNGYLKIKSKKLDSKYKKVSKTIVFNPNNPKEPIVSVRKTSPTLDSVQQHQISYDGENDKIIYTLVKDVTNLGSKSVYEDDGMIQTQFVYNDRSKLTKTTLKNINRKITVHKTSNGLKFYHSEDKNGHHISQSFDKNGRVRQKVEYNEGFSDTRNYSEDGKLIDSSFYLQNPTGSSIEVVSNHKGTNLTIIRDYNGDIIETKLS